MEAKSIMVNKEDSSDPTQAEVDDVLEDEEDNESLTDTQILTSTNLSDDSVEINVAQLVKDVESIKQDDAGSSAARRRLESVLEEKQLMKAMRELDSFDFED